MPGSDVSDDWVCGAILVAQSASGTVITLTLQSVQWSLNSLVIAAVIPFDGGTSGEVKITSSALPLVCAIT